MFSVGQRVKFTSTETVKEGRRKVEKSVEMEGVIDSLTNIGGIDYAVVECASFGGLTISAVKKFSEISLV